MKPEPGDDLKIGRHDHLDDVAAHGVLVRLGPAAASSDLAVSRFAS